MLIRTFGLLLAAALLALPGCSGTTEEGAGGDSGTSGEATSGGEAGSDAEGASGSGESSGASAGQSEDAASVADAGASDEPAADYDPALRDSILAEMQGAPIDQVQAQVDEVVQAYRSNPKDPDGVTFYIGLISNIGMMQAQQDNTEAAHTAFRAAADALAQAAKDEVELQDPVLAGFVYYNQACALSGAGKHEEALASLTSAIDAGFEQLSHLDEDPDLQAVRELPEFAAKRAEWQEQKVARMREMAREELANGETFPFDFDLVNVVDGTPVALNQFAGKVCIVDIWGTWCGPCVAEIPSFIKLQSEYGESGFQMIGLNSEGNDDDATKAKVADFIDANGINYPCALISEEVQQSASVQAFPTTLFIDKTGKVRMKAVGLHEYEYIEAVVQLLLDEEQAQESTGD